MAGKIDDALATRVREAARSEPRREIAVIVTLKPGTEPARLEQRGLRVQRVFESISAVSGRLAADDVDGLARLDEVERIEYDETVRAFAPEPPDHPLSP